MYPRARSYRASSRGTGETSPDPEETLELKQIIEEALAALSPRDRAIVLMWAEGYTQEEVGRHFGMTHQNVSLIIQKVRLQ